MNLKAAIIPAIASALALVACDEDNNTIGSSLIEDQVEVVNYTASAPTGVSVRDASIQSRTIMQLLGRLSASDYGRLESEIYTQYMPAVSIDEKYKGKKPDSTILQLAMYSTAMTGDSLVPMGVTVHKLNGPLPSPLFSDQDLSQYVDPAPLTSAVTVPSAIGLNSDSLLNLPVRYLRVKLPDSYGQSIADDYVNNPGLFRNLTSFVQKYPGFYITTTFGSGRVMRFQANSILLYYGKESFMPMAVSPEVLNDSKMSYTPSSTISRLAADGKTILVGPVGYNIEMTYPATELVNHYRANTGSLAVINAVKMSIPASTIDNQLGIRPPGYLLMVLKSKKDEFFRKNSIPDNETSFYAAFGASTNTYEFSDMRGYIRYLLAKDEIKPEDMEFVLMPVNVTTEDIQDYYYGTTSYITDVSPYVGEPRMAKLDLANAKITMTYSKQSLNN